MKFSKTIAGLILATLSTGVAYADCLGACYNNYSKCSASSDLQGMCAGERDICIQECRSGDGGGSRPLLPSADWAYIVYDINTGRSGVASRTPNGQAAMARAREACRRNGGKACEWRLSARDGCVGVASGKGGRGSTGWQTSRGNGGRAVLRKRILNECRRLGGQECQIRVDVCSWD